MTKPELRLVTSGSENFWQALGVVSGNSTGLPVTTETALGVPAVFAAVNFISGTIAGLPLHVYRRGKDDARTRVNSPLARMLHDAVDEDWTSFAWRKYSFEQVFTGGRSFTQILRQKDGRVKGLLPLDPSCVSVARKDGRKVYTYKEGSGAPEIRINSQNMIDIPFMLKHDGIGHYGPINTNREAIGLAQAVQEYANRFFANGGVPAFAITGNFVSERAMKAAAEDMQKAVANSAKENRQALVLPAGLEVKPLGGSMEDAQMLETKRHCVEEIARIYSLPPTFLQDLSKGTYANTEQQDLHFVKHTLKRWIEHFENELNLKLFGPRSTLYVEFAVDGLLRGDFKTRMEGHAIAIQNGMETPNEARQMENRPPKEGGENLMIQGATVPIGSQPQGQTEGDGETDDTEQEGETDEN